MMVTMGAVWDRTVEVVQGRLAMLAAIAVPTLFVPTIVRDGFVAYSTPGTGGYALIGSLLSLTVLVLTIWGQLALIAASSDPATDRTAAFRIARHRLLAAIGVSIVMLIAVVVCLIPLVVLLGLSGVDFSRMAAGQPMSTTGVSGGLLGAALIYMVVFAVAMLFVGARLSIWQAVIVNEAIGLRAIGRAWRLTRGLTWRIVGVIMLFVIVVSVATLAAQSVIGIIARLVLGAGNIATATWLGAIAAAAVSTPLIVVAVVFTTQLYLAVLAPRPATVATDAA